MARGVTLVPELDVLGHSAKMVQNDPQAFGTLSGSTIDFQLPSCLAGVRTIVAEMLDVFSSTPDFHIGGDESGFSHLAAFPVFVGERKDLVRAGGRTTVMWEGCDSSTPIPIDILIIHRESSYFAPDAMLQAGYTVVNAALFQGGERLGLASRIRFVQVQLVPGPTTGKSLQTASAQFLENPAELMVAGIVDNQSDRSTFPNPASASIDLGESKTLDGVTVHSRWGQGYSECYSVDLSSDGTNWTQAVDFTANSQPATSAGYVHSFATTPARYLRLNTASNSWFPAGRFPRIVEVQANAAP